MPQVNVLSEFEYLLAKVHELHFYEQDKTIEQTLRFKEFLKKGPAKGYDYRTATSVGLGYHVSKGELQKVTFDAYEPGTERVTTWKTYALAWRASEELIEDSNDNGRIEENHANIFSDVNKQLTRSARMTQEAISADMILKADSTVVTSTWPGAGRDGLALSSISHVTKKNPIKTWSNKQGAMSLSSLALAEAAMMLHDQPSQEGFPTQRPTRYELIVGPYWEFRLEEIMNTQKQLDTPNNNADGLNKIKSKIKVIVDEHLGFDYKGWMLTNPDVHRLHYFERKKPTFATERDFDSGGLKFKSTFRYGIDHLSPYGVVFCPGP